MTWVEKLEWEGIGEESVLGFPKIPVKIKLVHKKLLLNPRFFSPFLVTLSSYPPVVGFIDGALPVVSTARKRNRKTNFYSIS